MAILTHTAAIDREKINRTEINSRNIHGSRYCKPKTNQCTTGSIPWSSHPLPVTPATRKPKSWSKKHWQGFWTSIDIKNIGTTCRELTGSKKNRQSIKATTRHPHQRIPWNARCQICCRRPPQKKKAGCSVLGGTQIRNRWGREEPVIGRRRKGPLVTEVGRRCRETLGWWHKETLVDEGGHRRGGRPCQGQFYGGASPAPGPGRSGTAIDGDVKP